MRGSIINACISISYCVSISFRPPQPITRKANFNKIMILHKSMHTTHVIVRAHICDGSIGEHADRTVPFSTPQQYHHSMLATALMPQSQYLAVYRCHTKIGLFELVDGFRVYSFISNATTGVASVLFFFIRILFYFFIQITN